MKQFGELLAAKRKEMNILQKDLAKKIGSAPSTVNNWENGVNLPDCEKFSRVCEVLQVPFTYFLESNVKENLSTKEYEYIKTVRSLDEEGRRFVEEVIKRESERNRIKKEYERLKEKTEEICV